MGGVCKKGSGTFFWASVERVDMMWSGFKEG